MNKRKLATWIVCLLILATLAFIWHNSLLPKEESKEDSLGVVAILKPILGPIIGAENVTDHFVRKLAHFTEFSVLGAEMACLSLLLTKRRIHGMMHCLFAGLLAAVIDESLQLLNDRGSQVQDVLLDFGGVLFAVLLIHLIAYLRRTCRGAH